MDTGCEMTFTNLNWYLFACFGICQVVLFAVAMYFMFVKDDRGD